MKQLAPGLWRLKEFPAPTVNIYLAEDAILPGHGPAVTDIGAFERFVGALPA